jgi:hypothetical protein
MITEHESWTHTWYEGRMGSLRSTKRTGQKKSFTYRYKYKAELDTYEAIMLQLNFSMLPYDFGCICTIRQILRNCLIVLMHLKLVLFVWIFLDGVWIPNLMAMYIYRCCMCIISILFLKLLNMFWRGFLWSHWRGGLYQIFLQIMEYAKAKP